MTLIELRPGEGVPVLLLHAFPLDHRMWAPAARALTVSNPVLALDVPDRAHPGPEDLDAAADAAAAQLRAAGHRRAVVAGVSMGGYLALALAERHPDLVAALALLDTRSTADSAQTAANRLRVADEVVASGSVATLAPMVRSLLGETSLAVRHGVVDAIAGWIAAASPAAVAWCQRAMAARPDRTAALAGFAGPVTVLVGDEDGLVGPEDAGHLVSAHPDAHLVVVPRAGHLAAFEEPVEVAAALTALVQRV